MLVTFHSKAYENITYFGDIAQHLLTLMGHSATIPGAIKAVDLAQALEQLELALGKKKEHAIAETEQHDNDVGLSKRAIPLIHLLQASIKNNCDVLWDA